MAVHVVLEANEAYAEWCEEERLLAEQRDALSRQILAVREADRRALEDHEAKVAEAVSKRKKIPERPQPSDYSHLDTAHALLSTAEQQHRARRTGVLAKAARSGAIDALRERERLRMGLLLPHVEAFLSARKEIADDAGVMVQLERAVDSQAGLTVRPSRADRIEPRPTTDEVIAAVLNGTSLLDPRQVSAVDRSPRIQIDGAVDATRLGYEQARLGFESGVGFREGGGFGNHDKREGKPIRSSRGVQI